MGDQLVNKSLHAVIDGEANQWRMQQAMDQVFCVGSAPAAGVGLKQMKLQLVSWVLKWVAHPKQLCFNFVPELFK